MPYGSGVTNTDMQLTSEPPSPSPTAPAERLRSSCGPLPTEFSCWACERRSGSAPHLHVSVGKFPQNSLHRHVLLTADVHRPAIIMSVSGEVFVPQSLAETLRVDLGVLRHVYCTCRSHYLC